MNAAGRRAKRRLAQEGREGGCGGQARKPQKKAKLKKEKSREDNPPSPSPAPALSPSPSPLPSPSPSLLSEDSEDDLELCPAGVCQQPGGDEVRMRLNGNKMCSA